MSNLKLLYNTPSALFTEALPIGNGKLGATIFGGITEEKIVFNEDTLYSGFPHHIDLENAKKALPEIRKLAFMGKIPQAERIIESTFPDENNQFYQTVGNLHISFDHTENVCDYKRSLNLENAIHTVSYNADGVRYLRESFVSAPNKVFVCKLSADKPFNFDISFESEMRHTTNLTKNGIIVTGKATDRCWPQIEYKENLGMTYEAQYKVLLSNGSVNCVGGKIAVSNTTQAFIFATSDTSFIAFDKMPTKDPHPFCEKVLSEALKKDYETLKKSHEEDYQALFNRCRFTLFADDKGNLPLGERVKASNRNDIVELAFAYGRYLLIASSRVGTQPTNLQGIWNDELAPMFASAYTMNINLPMQYWLAETTGLESLTEPLLTFIDELRKNGEITARELYDCSGWCAHHNVDIWRKTAPLVGMENATRWGMWPMAGVWIVAHYFENYLFSNDLEALKKAYPSIKGAALFCMDFLLEKDGYLVTYPATSPENIYYNEKGELCQSGIMTTMDNALIREVFDMTVFAAEKIGVDFDLIDKIKNTKAKLLPFKILEDGMLAEWNEPYTEAALAIGHVSPAYGLFPGSLYTRDKKLLEAIKKYIYYRSQNIEIVTGWYVAWLTALFARIKDREMVCKLIDEFTGFYEFPLLICPDLQQCDFALGCTASIVETLLQSHNDMEFLPAIPKEWASGKVTGLRARGGFTVDIEWANGKGIATVYSTTDNSFKNNGNMYTLKKGEKIKIEFTV